MKKLLSFPVLMFFTCIFAVNANAGIAKFAFHAAKSVVFKSPAHNVVAVGKFASFPVRHPKKFGKKFAHVGKDAKKIAY